MILTCPECSTQYRIKDGSIGPNGRTVNCTKCNAVWFEQGQISDPDELALTDNKTVQMQVETLTTAGKTTPELETQAELDLGDAASRPSVGAHIAMRDRADAEKLKRRKRIISAIWVITIALLLIAAILAFFKRQDIVNRTPIAASAYQALGINVKLGGLDISEPETETRLVEGEPVLFVKAEIENLTRQAKAAPYLGFRLRNRNGESVAEWYVETGTVLGKKSKTIETQYPNPPVDGMHLSYGFAEE